MEPRPKALSAPDIAKKYKGEGSPLELQTHRFDPVIAHVALMFTKSELGCRCGYWGFPTSGNRCTLDNFVFSISIYINKFHQSSCGISVFFIIKYQMDSWYQLLFSKIIVLASITASATS
jgi:hypothetical protein